MHSAPTPPTTEAEPARTEPTNENMLSSLMPISPTRNTLKFDRIREKRLEHLTVRYWQDAEQQVEPWLALYRLALPVVERFVGAPLEGHLTLEMVSGQHFAANPVAGVVQVVGAMVQDPAQKQECVSALSYQLGRVLWYRASSDKNYKRLEPSTRPITSPFTRRHPMQVDVEQRSPDWLIEAALLPLTYIWQDARAWRDHLKTQLSIYVAQATQAGTKGGNRKGLELHTLSKTLDTLSIDAPELARALITLRGQSISQRHPDWQRRVSRALSIDFALSGSAALALVTRTSLEQWEAIFIDDLARWQHAWL